MYRYRIGNRDAVKKLRKAIDEKRERSYDISEK